METRRNKKRGRDEISGGMGPSEVEQVTKRRHLNESPNVGAVTQQLSNLPVKALLEQSPPLAQLLASQQEKQSAASQPTAQTGSNSQYTA